MFRKLRPLAFWALSVLFLVEFFVSCRYATVDLESYDYVLLAVYFGSFAAASVFAAIRMQRGKGRVAGGVLLSVFSFCVFLCVVLTLALTHGNARYNAPWQVWLTHGFLATAYLAALAAVVFPLHSW